MATFTKNIRTIYAENGLAASAAATSSAVDLSTALQLDVQARIKNGTAPTVGAKAIVEASGDDSNYYEWGRAQAGILATTIYDFTFPDIRGPKYVRVRFEGAAGQTVSATAIGHEITSIA